MKIQESYAHLNKNGEPIEIDGPLLILADDGRALVEIRLEANGSIHINAGGFCKHGGQVLDSAICIKPESASAITLCRPVYQ